MNFECPSCKKSGQVDDSKIPEDGVYATCVQCNSKFLIKRETPKDFRFEQVIPALQLAEGSSTTTQSQKCGDATKAKSTDSINPDDIDYYKTAIGKNFDKYIDVIKLVKSGNDNPASWHWPAFFVGIPWAFYRKMYKIGFFYFFTSCAESELTLFIK